MTASLATARRQQAEAAVTAARQQRPAVVAEPPATPPASTSSGGGSCGSDGSPTLQCGPDSGTSSQSGRSAKLQVETDDVHQAAGHHTKSCFGLGACLSSAFRQLLQENASGNSTLILVSRCTIDSAVGAASHDSRPQPRQAAGLRCRQRQQSQQATQGRVKEGCGARHTAADAASHAGQQPQPWTSGTGSPRTGTQQRRRQQKHTCSDPVAAAQDGGLWGGMPCDAAAAGYRAAPHELSSAAAARGAAAAAAGAGTGIGILRVPGAGSEAGVRCSRCGAGLGYRQQRPRQPGRQGATSWLEPGAAADVSGGGAAAAGMQARTGSRQRL